LSGRFARFGRQAADALKVWRDLDGASDLIIEDDRSDPAAVAPAIEGVATLCDVLLGPYSTQLVRRAGEVVAGMDRLLWNHGGSGDDVEAANPGHVVSVLTPASRYAEPFVSRIVADGAGGTLWIRHGQGRFGRQVARGAAAAAEGAEMTAVMVGPGDELEPGDTAWHLLVAGTFEDDIEIVRQAASLPRPPDLLCSVAAGVRAFADALGQDPSGIFSVGQWLPGATDAPRLGPDEQTFIRSFASVAGVAPDYPAAQAFAAAVIAAHATRQAGGTTRDIVWPIASQLDTSTLFGDFAVDPSSGVQLKHETVLMRWAEHGLTLG
jgi:ABC-type branched-subunit amino acid transport system substrate-binding protein